MPLLDGVWLVNAEGVPHQVPNNQAVINSFVGRGWRVTDLPSDLDSDDEEFQNLLAELSAEKEESPEQPPAEAKSATKNKKESE